MHPQSATRKTGRMRWLAASAAALTMAVAVSASGIAQAEEAAVTDGDLVWGVKQSFRSYIAGPIAHGLVTVSDGASQAESNGVFTFVNGSGTYDAATGTVSAAYEGSVHFQGHKGFGVPADQYALDMKVSDLRIQISGSDAFLVADVASKGLSTGAIEVYDDVQFAALDLTGITPTVSGDVTTYSNVPATLTEAGVPAFADFYSAETVLDAITFSLNTAGGEEPEPSDSVAQTITTTIVAPEGGLSISVDENQVALPTPVLNIEGTKLVSSGALNPVTVTDLRSANPGWNANGQVSAFTSADSSFGGENLGWTPEVVSTSDGQVVTPGASVAPGVGIATSSTLGSANAGEGRGTAVLGADLELEVATDTAPGAYSATVTLTVI